MRDFLVSESLKHLSEVPASDGLWVTPLCHPAGRESRHALPLLSDASSVDEVLIADARASLRPAQLVEQKLISQLKSVYLPMSHVRTTTLCTGRSQFSVPAVQAPQTTSGLSRGRRRVTRPQPESRTVTPLCRS